MREKKETTAICFRLSDKTLFKLDWLCKTLNQTRGEVVANLVCSSFDDMNGNEELKALFGELKEIEEKMKTLTSSLNN